MSINATKTGITDTIIFVMHGSNCFYFSLIRNIATINSNKSICWRYLLSYISQYLFILQIMKESKISDDSRVK